MTRPAREQPRAAAAPVPLHAPAPVLDLSAAFDEHAPALLGFAMNALHDRGLAEDCVQETFLRAWRSRESYSAERASARTWLFAIARNVVIDVHRSLQRLPRLVATEVLEEVPGDERDPLEPLAMAEALARLSEQHRQVVVAIHLRGESYADLSSATGVPVATLRTRAFYALRALRDHLASADPTDEERS
ncbi:sigma-70 family RNA polymerase sigma factor [Rathayibacter tanaceti]|uniref:ECF RNA polymerase sigma factor SigL n=2 Tax=Rathayibacter tanaceti TaxID=1671680 RepID=A0A162F7U7_9MICO|nr:sigma-70 family RNA polymerase sigma factor [Rathayibacter tanaceti]KZX20233.1 ECF RNA polymerase sigma factor SigL [Rathayibacter tanaceti]QHC56543.1 sigma-70 family RNA polymerase sigma factor [Rathayibacter tanaceti]TCO36757.1 RNA polymerase sigma-70 factor (ECF subfamily) [Rathayibacter tanaceti]